MVAVDTSGDVIVTGVLEGTADFGTGPLQTQGYGSIFLAKYDCAGTPKWAKVFGAPLTPGDAPGAVTTDAQNAILLTGQFYDGTIDFGCGPLQGVGLSTGFAVKLDPAGACVWSKRFGGSYMSGMNTGYANNGAGIAVDATGNVFLSGVFEGSSDFGAGPVESQNGGSSGDLFLMKLDPAGNFAWFKDYGISGDGQVLMTRDPAGNLILFGNNQNASLNFGGGPLLKSGVFLAKVDPMGGYLWANAFGQQTFAFCQGIAADSMGNVFIGGTYSGAADFGGGPLPAPVALSGFAGFVAGFSSAGGYLFSHGGGASTLENTVYAVAVAATGTGLFAGSFAGTLDLSGPKMIAGAPEDAFIVELDPSGTFVSFKQFGNSSQEFARSTGIAVSPAGRVVLIGEYGGPVDFGNGPLPNAGNATFVAQIAP
jgi:hypothetical protein